MNEEKRKIIEARNAKIKAAVKADAEIVVHEPVERVEEDLPVIETEENADNTNAEGSDGEDESDAR